ncbi:hypothetical protein MIT9_P0650 [Methylomarinovum caldicuralii]|uniref:Abasic site processing protein n=1 Tax=Methylomarinovum caldicuralii TaxID=438856 RepID=A0AAU9CNI1_9GAMM|nr:SOS response-associated peptidase [Methylomarinovum caldicuralii]BCX81072.1 hypothetical protein MIT9_P0650 [Methylomarinovum caldicuralii]
MCGRFFLTASGEEIRRTFATVNTIDWQPRYNIAPSQPIPQVRRDAPGRLAELARWGLIPFWAKDAQIGQRLINARAENLHERPAFRAALRRRRCLIPASGFYEWARSGRRKQPYAVVPRDGRLIAFAGLWEDWRNPETEETVRSCVIITTDANETLKPLHHRMPVVLEPEHWNTWLDPSHPAPQTLLRPCRDTLLRTYPVSTYVNNPHHDDPRCLAPQEPTQPLFTE